MTNVATRTSAAAHWRAASPPRIAVGAVCSVGMPAWAVSRFLGLLTGGGRVAAADAIATSRRLFWGYVPFALQLVPFTALSRTDIELATLRTAWNSGMWYEWRYHVHFSRLGGLSPETVERVSRVPDAEGWGERQRALLTAVDELHADRMIADTTWARLREFLDDRQLVELCMLVGHYEMLAMLLKSVGVEPEPGTLQRGPLAWLRRDDDSDRLMPSWVPAFNRAVTNRIAGPLAGRVPPLGVVLHRGRTSGRAYRTPVLALRDGDTIAIPLAYGDRSGWVRNLLAAGGGEIQSLGRTQAITNPRVIDATQTDGLPAPARLAARLAKVLVADITRQSEGEPATQAVRANGAVAR